MKRKILIVLLFSLFLSALAANSQAVYVDPAGDIGFTEWYCSGVSCPAGHYAVLDDGIRQPFAPITSDYIYCDDADYFTDWFTLTATTTPTFSTIRLWVYGQHTQQLGDPYVRGNVNINGVWQTPKNFNLGIADSWQSVEWTGCWDYNSLNVELYCEGIEFPDPVDSAYIYAMYVELSGDVCQVINCDTNDGYYCEDSYTKRYRDYAPCSCSNTACSIYTPGGSIDCRDEYCNGNTAFRFGYCSGNDCVYSQENCDSLTGSYGNVCQSNDVYSEYRTYYCVSWYAPFEAHFMAGCSSNSQYTFVQDCGDDGLACTDECLSGSCVSSTPQPGNCLIGGACYTDGQQDPSNPCQECNTAVSQTSWSIKTGMCLISGACYTDGQQNPANPCQVCDSSVSQASWTNKADGASCSDGLYCTTTDTCQVGTCQGGATRDCSAFTDQCNIGRCDEATYSCYADPVTDGTSCTDGLYCSGVESCLSGTCQSGTAPSCVTDSLSCTVCDEPTDSCVINQNQCYIGGMCYNAGDVNAQCQECNPSYSQTQWYDDDSRCTDACQDNTRLYGGYCANGICGYSSSEDCLANICIDNVNLMRGDGCSSGICLTSTAPCDDFNRCTADICNQVTDSCEFPYKPLSTACELDNNPCTIDHCDGAGSCVLDYNKDCSAFTDQCNNGMCNTATGECYASPVADGILCDDELYCTADDRCSAGSCVATPGSRDCSDSYACTTDSCNEDTGRCDNILQNNKCLIGATCYNTGAINQGNQCQECIPAQGQYSWTTDTTNTCSSYCSGTMSYHSGVCTTGACVYSSTDCTANLCEGATRKYDGYCYDVDGSCRYSTMTCPDYCVAGSCKDCLSGQTRPCQKQDGVCQGSQEICVNNAWPGCDYSTILGYEPAETSCADGLDNDCDSYTDNLDSDCFECFSDAECSNKCSGSVRQFNGRCLNGFCEYTQEDCSQNFCSGNTLYRNGMCDPDGCLYDGLTCSDGIPCTADSCDSATASCRYTPDNSRCDDTISCTADSCSAVSGCINTLNNTLCNDNVDCTTDTCNALTGCDSTPDNSYCDNGIYCDGAEYCDRVQGCQGSTAVDCNDYNGSYCIDGSTIGYRDYADCTEAGQCSAYTVTETRACDNAWCDGNSRVYEYGCESDVCLTDRITCQSGCSNGECLAINCTPSAELCDSIDNDCDIFIDEDALGNPLNESCYTGPEGTLGVGICISGIRTCSGGSWGDCEGEITPRIELCGNGTGNGYDDDCDGETDEDCECLSGQTADCGIGSCTGRRECANGRWSNCDSQGRDCGICCICNNDGRETYDEAQDNDCSATVCSTDSGCGIGCGENIWGDYSATSANNCRALRQCTQNPCSINCEPDIDSDSYSLSCGDCNDANPLINPMAAEQCDNLDNDCDSQVDESLVQSCGSIVGICNDGYQPCQSGVWGSCIGEIGPIPEVCNGLDDDCDSSIDEDCECTPGTTQLCGIDVGECQKGLQLCQPNKRWGKCVGELKSIWEVCNGLDDDCDGMVDELLPDCPFTCGDAVCDIFESCETCEYDCGECAPKDVYIRFGIKANKLAARVFTVVDLNAQIKNVAQKTLHNVKVRLTVPNGWQATKDFRFNKLASGEAKNFSFRFTVPYTRIERGVVRLNVNSSEKYRFKMLPVFIDIPDFIVAPEPVLTSYLYQDDVILNMLVNNRNSSQGLEGLEVETNINIGRTTIIADISKVHKADARGVFAEQNAYPLDYLGGKTYNIRGFLFQKGKKIGESNEAFDMTK